MGAHARVPAEVPQGTLLSDDVLLIGGDGFLGRHVISALGPARRVTVVSRGRGEPISGVETLRADRRDPQSLAAALRGRRFQFTVDLAAYDARGVEALWQVPETALGRYVLISSGQVYLVTEGARAPFREGDFRRPVMKAPAEDTPDFPQWKYGVGKRAAEAAALALRRHHGARVVVLRLPVLQGEGDKTRRLWAWLERFLDGGPVPLPDGGRQATRFLEATDAARAIARLADGAWPKRAVFNLAAARSTSLKRFLTIAAAAAGVEPRFLGLASRDLAAAGLALDAYPYAGHWSSVLDAGRARRELSFSAAAPRDYLPRVVRWHLENRPASHAGYAQRERERGVLSRSAASA